MGSKDFDNNIYTHNDWGETPRDADHGKIKEGDFLVFYFSGKTKIKEKHNKILKTFCKVQKTESDNKKISFRKLAELKGLTYDVIKNLSKVLEERGISNPFKKLGSEGFNIKNISREEFQILYNIDKKFKNIFLCSIQSSPAFSHFTDTMIHPQLTNEINVTSELKKYSKLCIWGTKYTEQYKKHGDKIRKNDLILFYKDYYRYIAKFIGTERNSKLAEKLWGKDNDQTWELIMYFLPENVREISVEKEKLNEFIPGYSRNAYPRNNNPFLQNKISKRSIGMMLHED